MQWVLLFFIRYEIAEGSDYGLCDSLLSYIVFEKEKNPLRG